MKKHTIVIMLIFAFLFIGLTPDFAQKLGEGKTPAKKTLNTELTSEPSENQGNKKTTKKPNERADPKAEEKKKSSSQLKDKSSKVKPAEGKENKDTKDDPKETEKRLRLEVDQLKSKIGSLESENDDLKNSQKNNTQSIIDTQTDIGFWKYVSYGLISLVIGLLVLIFLLFKKLKMESISNIAKECFLKYSEDLLKIENLDKMAIASFLRDKDKKFRAELGTPKFFEALIPLINSEKSKRPYSLPVKEAVIKVLKVLEDSKAEEEYFQKPQSSAPSTPQPVVIEKKRLERFFKTEGLKSFHAGKGDDRPTTNEHLFCLVWKEDTTTAEVNLTIVSPNRGEEVRPFDYIKFRYEKLANYIVVDGDGNTQVTQVEPGEATLQNGQWVITKPVKVRFR